MTKKIFTDSNGNEFELVEFIPDKDHQHQEKTYLVRPYVKQDKQTYQYWLGFWCGEKKYLLDNNYDFTPEQAKAVSEAIEALMELLQTDKHTFNDFEDGRHDAWTTIAKAREALNEAN